MPPALRSKLALAVLFGTFLIPVTSSSLRGLTHLLTCRGAADIPFTLVVPEQGKPVIVSSNVVVRGQPTGVCGGLVLDMAVGRSQVGEVTLRLPITNRTEYDWRGTVRLVVNGETVPVDIGEVRAGATVEDSVRVAVKPGSVEIGGSLLIGP